MKKCISTILLITLLLSLFSVTASAGGDAMAQEDIRTLLNGVALYPQQTGYEELDEALERVLAPYRGEDVYTQVKAAYDWTILNINFSWAPYSQNWAPAYDCFAVEHDLTYDAGLQEVIPYETANRAYHALTEHEGVCYDYAALFAVMARYIGIDSYIHTGMFTFEPIYGSGVGHHGWVELDLGGEMYIFDSQRDYRLSADGTAAIPYDYFGISMEKSWRYDPEDEINAARDAQFLPVTQERSRMASITAVTSPSCLVDGLGLYPLESEVTLKALFIKPFLGWFDKNGKLLCSEETYTFTAHHSVCVYAICEGEYFTDMNEDDWYFANANEALERGIVSGVAPFEFDAQSPLTRAMALTILSRFAGDDGTSADAGFEDVASGSWYESAVNWGVANGITTGYEDQTFRPDRTITREEFITMLVRYAKCDAEGSELTYADTDDISPYALNSMRIAQAISLIEGYDDGTIRPQNILTRAEGVTILMRLINWLER